MNNKIYKATVIGAGPSGIAIMGQLLSRKVFPILWIDPSFEGGKMAFYRKVPANTKGKFFVNFMKECPAYNEFLEDKGNQMNPMEIFRNSDLNIPPSLSKAYDMCNSLTKNIENKYKSDVILHKDSVKKLLHSDDKWHISTNAGMKYDTEKVILAIGSKPRKLEGLNKTQIPLEVLVNDDPEKLANYVKKDDIIGVKGSSVSSILSLKHLKNLQNPPKKLIVFIRKKFVTQFI